MKTRKRLLASVLCLFMIAMEVAGLAACTAKNDCHHHWGEWSVTTKATCTADGVQERKCAECGETETSAVKALGHDWADATCSAPKTCKTCQATEGNPLSGHTYNQKTVKAEALKSAADCVNPAVYYLSCSCGAISANEAETFTDGAALGHKDENGDKVCDRGCGATMSDTHGDSATDSDHVCDCGCGQVLEACSDAAADGDHKCDVCGKADVTDHAYGEAACGAPATCSDCGLTTGSALAHKDEDMDHACDYGCGGIVGVCEDANLDHACDYGCGKAYGDHADSPADNDHVCDYGCNAILEACEDAAADGDHSCDVCGNADLTACSYGDATCGAPATCVECGATVGGTLEHQDENHDHICDNNCGKNDMGAHADSDADNDHACDYGCGAIFSNCADTDTDGDHACDVCGKADVSAHAYVEDAELATPATCYAAATKTFVCNCGDSYEETDGDALGHDINGVKAVETQINGCEYALVYTCRRTGCGEEVQGETVYHHDYVATISTPATCVTPGEKTFRCADCGDTGKAAEEIPADATGHNWVIGTETDGSRVDTCSVCATTKTVIVSNGNSASSNASDLASADVQLKVDEQTNANIQLGQGVADAIGDRDITISAGVVDETTLRELGVSDEQLGQIGENTVFDFTITDKDGEYISGFGEENFVTITLPYTLSEGEDVDSIAVWFISDTCQVAECDKGEDCVDAHKLVSIMATYNNGHVTFRTNHFSYYTVTRLTPAERCALYNHSYVSQHVEGNCLKDSYDLYVCVRCHHTFVDEESLVVADGHDYAAETVAATCTEKGYVQNVCVDCGHSYRTQLNATGHDWSIVESVEASCAADGYTKYRCGHCGEEYTVSYAKLAHAYTATVVAATCTADGYTRYDCDHCEYSYTDAYVNALGHRYEAGAWSWEANGNEATLNLVCVHDNTHVTTRNATVEMVEVKGECSNYVIRTYTAAVEYNGVTYTDEMVIRQGNPNHSYSEEWSWNEDEHWHACTCGDKTDVAAHAFGNGVVTKAPTCGQAGEETVSCTCGVSKVVTIPATGNHTYENGVCVDCGREEGNSYYIGLIRSWKDMDGFAIRLCDLSFECKEMSDDLMGTLQLVNGIKQIDVAELTLYVEDGELGGAATGSIELSDGPFVNAKTIYQFQAVIYEGYLYVSSEQGQGGSSSGMDIKVSVDALADEFLGDYLGSDYRILLDFFSDTLIPAVETLIDLNDADVNAILEDAFNMIFTFEKQADGNVVATLDFDKLYALNENLATKSVAEVVDLYFGEGTFDSLADWVLKMLDMEICEIPDYLDEIGLDSADLMDEINNMAALMGEEDFDIEELLYDEELEGVTLGDLLGQIIVGGRPGQPDETEVEPETSHGGFETSVEVETMSPYGAYRDSFETMEITTGAVSEDASDDSAEDDEGNYRDAFFEIVDTLREYSLYELIADTAEDVQEAVDMALDVVSDGGSLYFVTDPTGMLISVNVSADDVVYAQDDEEWHANFDLAILINQRIEVTWSDIIDEIENNIQLPDMSDEDLSCGMGRTYGVVTYRGQDYSYEGFYLDISKAFIDQITNVTIYSDCNDWMHYDVSFAGEQYSCVIASITVDDRNVMLLIDYESGEVVEIQETPVGYKAIYEDGTEREFVMNITDSEDLADAMALYMDIYFAVFDEAEGRYDPAIRVRDYYYNPQLDQYASESQHNLQYEYELHGDSCEDGCTKYTTCLNCDYYEAQTRYYCRTERVEIDLSEYGVCGGVVDTYQCEACGKVEHFNYWIYCDLDWQEEDIYDEDGNYLGYKRTRTCWNCGFTVENTVIYEYHDSCRYTWYESTSLRMGETCILYSENSETGYNHQYEYTYEFEGDSCEDGYYVNVTCTKCGETERYHSWGHREEWREDDLSAYGFCGGRIEEEYCVACGEVFYTRVYDYCSWNHVEQLADGTDVYQCDWCGGVKHSLEQRSEKDEDCYYTKTRTTIYLMNGEEVCRGEEINRYREHDLDFIVDMMGTSCTDGYVLHWFCKDCGYSYDETYYGHGNFELFALDEADGFCESHAISVYGCLCGHTFHTYYNAKSFERDKETGSHYCSACGLTLVNAQDVVDDGCSRTVYTTFGLYAQGWQLYYVERADTYENHDFDNMEIITEDGVTVMTVSCSACGLEHSREILQAVLEYNDNYGAYFYDYTFTPTESGTYTIQGIGRGDTYVTLYRVEQGKLIDLAHNDDGYGNQFLLSCNLVAGTTYVYRIRYYDWTKGEGTIDFFFAQGEDNNCVHEETREFSILLDGAESCYDGVRIGSFCVYCGEIQNFYVNYGHTTTYTSIDLDEYGTCYGGTIGMSSCACGQNTSMDIYAEFCGDWSSNEYTDDWGRLVFVESCVCSECGLRYSYSYYSVEDAENCSRTTYYTKMISVGDQLVVNNEYSRSYDQHDYEQTVILMGGEGSSCEDGVQILYRCKTCGYESTGRHYFHEQYAKEQIDLSQLGCACGGYATVFGCACGQYEYLSLEGSFCEWNTEWCGPWIENVVEGWHNTLHGGDYFDYSFWEYTCAVTNPACGYKIRQGEYWLKAEDECAVYRYVTWQFGYDEETGTCLYEVTYPTGDWVEFHDFEIYNSEEEGKLEYDCPDCGSYRHEYQYYNEEGYRIKYERSLYNALNNGNDRYIEEVHEYNPDEYEPYHSYYRYVSADGTEEWTEEWRTYEEYEGPFGEDGYKYVFTSLDSSGYETREERAVVYYRGFEYMIYESYQGGNYWHRYENTYSFEDGCTMTTAYTNSYGEEWTSVDSIICQMHEETVIQYPTCTQDGLYGSSCMVCDKQIVETMSATDHNWVHLDNDWYYCCGCGLENANGASGEVVMEDLTAKYGDGEYYVVGYYNRDNVEFLQYVSLILADGSEVIVEADLEFFTPDGLRAYAFSKAAVDAWAAENGYTDYDVRFTMVPRGAEGSYDYGITFTEPTVVGDTIVGRVSFKDYVGAGESKFYTITPTEDGVWTFTSFASRDTYGCLYNANGDYLTSDDDGGMNSNFCMTYSLKAGETYTVEVRWYSGGVSGEMPLLFTPGKLSIQDDK